MDLTRLAPLTGRRVEQSWGCELIWAEHPQYAGKILRIDPGGRLSYQYHERKVETMYVLDGVVQIDVAAANGPRRTYVLVPGQSFHIPAGLRHRLTALERCTVLETSTAELDDCIHLEDPEGPVSR